MPSLIQSALILEAVANIGSAAASILAPKWSIAGLLAPDAAANPSPSTLTLVQVFGGFMVALTVPLVMAIPDGPYAIVVRKVTYYTLGVAELALIPLLLAKSRQGVSSGFAPEKLTMSASVLVPFLLFRGYALFANPKVMQSESEGKAKEK